MLGLLKNDANVAFTENGARAYATTQSYLVDFFAQGGAMRSRSDNDIISMFTKAFAEDTLLAMKMLFYFRDIRGGQGERRLFRTIMRYMADAHTDVVKKNIHLIAEYGRWDDYYSLFGSKVHYEVLDFMQKQFITDLQSEYPSLLAKWLKSENTSSDASVALATMTRKHFDLTPRQYRKALTKLRLKIRIVETLMSKNQWNEIEYSKLPSKAGMQYREAFKKHDNEGRYEAFIESLKKGETKINAGTLYPYEIVGKVMGNYGDHDETLEQLWKALPDYIGKDENSIAVVDTSGSMFPNAINVALSLGVYLAERNTGEYHNHFFTFNSNPVFQEIVGTTLAEKLRNMMNVEWGGSTNVKKVFDKILQIAVLNRLPQDQMVKKLYIISDMEFDGCVTGARNNTLFENIRQEYRYEGYEMPQLVFWNVDARNTQFPMKVNDQGVMLVSGMSPTIFKNLMQEKSMTPYELMIDVLNGERYSKVTI